MPAIDLDRLDREIERALVEIVDARAVAKGLGELFRRHGGASKHGAVSLASSEPERSSGSPPLVTEQVIRRLREIPLTPELREELAERLWRSGYREQRQVATALLSGLSPERALERAVEWAGMRTSRAELLMLIKGSLWPQLRRAGARGWQRIESWIRGEATELRRLGLIALEVAGEDPAFTVPPSAYAALRGVNASLRGWARLDFERALAALARRHRLEVIAFLEGETRQDPSDRALGRLLDRLRAGEPQAQG